MKPSFIFPLFIVVIFCFMSSCKKHNSQHNSVTGLKHWHHIRYIGTDTIINTDTVLLTSYASNNTDLEWNGYYFYANGNTDSMQEYFNEPLCPGYASHVAYMIFYNYYPLTGNSTASIDNNCPGNNSNDYYWTY